MSYSFNKVKSFTIAKTIYKINNDPIARKYSKDSNKFSYKIHQSWLKNVLRYNFEKVYLVMFKKKIIGILRDKKKRIRHNLSWVISKNFRNLGHGKKILKKYTSKKKKFSASIHKNNVPSIKIAYFAGFKIKKRNQNFIEFYKN